jgi:NADPH:quinone reductase-like Zn-dependent oxidoreductase
VIQNLIQTISKETMKAIRIHDYGDAGVFGYEDAPLPEMRADEVLVKIHAASVNPVDWRMCVWEAFGFNKSQYNNERHGSTVQFR